MMSLMASVSTPPTDDLVRFELDRILSADRFARAKRQQRFLRYAVTAALNGQAESLKESVLGVEVFDRPATFDPRTDNIVRVEVRRLRHRLEEYYRAEGRDDEIVIAFPVGSYVPHLAHRESVADTGAHRSRVSRRRGYLIAIAAGGVMAMVAGLLILWLQVPRRPSVAVLPFADYTGAPDSSRADGVAEGLIQELAEIKGLRVVARTSAFRFRNRTDLDFKEIAGALGVEMLVEGSLHAVGDRFRITMRLVRADSRFPVWAGSQEAGWAEFASAGHAMAAALAEAMHVPSPKAAAHATPAEARELMLQARYLAAKGGPQNQALAVERYQRTVSIDPNNGRAWGALARIWSLMAFHDSEVAHTVVPKVKETAERAIRLDPAYADPYVALARVAWMYDWNWTAAEGAWRRAIAVNPNSASARQSLALGLASRGRFPEAVAESRRALELDPLSYAASNDLGIIYYLARQYDQAIAHGHRALGLAPASPFPHALLGIAHAGAGRLPEAIQEFDGAAGQVRPVEILGRLGNVYARSGRRGEAEAIAREVAAVPGAGRIYSAMVEVGLGNLDTALQLLERSADRKETDVVFIGVDPIFDPLCHHRRYSALLARLHLN